ncbi:MAG: tetratricopeptide repeat protein, partial [Bacteroidota bacterium]|nr:tetratricopeptide repeat protein [Bacteroidota bacterium]
YDYTATVLLQIKDYDSAYQYLVERNEIEPSAFSDKWLGIIDLYHNRVDSAKKNLANSLKLDDKDAQVWYNLAGVYVDEKDYRQALQMVNRALSLQSNYPEAFALRAQLQQAAK